MNDINATGIPSPKDSNSVNDKLSVTLLSQIRYVIFLSTLSFNIVSIIIVFSSSPEGQGLTLDPRTVDLNAVILCE